MKEMKRSERRHHRRRLYKRRLADELSKVYVSIYSTPEEEMERCKLRARVRVDTAATCSCHMCGNPRRRNARGGKSVLTMQELKALDSFNDQKKSVDTDH